LAWITVLLLAASACGFGQQPASQPSQEDAAPGEGQTKETTNAAPKTTAPKTTSETAQAVVGEALSAGGIELRVLDQLSTEEYFYGEFVDLDGNVSSPSVSDSGQPTVYSQAGKFVVVSYSVRNTGKSPFDDCVSAMLLTKGGESYQEADEPEHPHSGGYGFELAPRGVGVGQFIFDVPQDAEPSKLAVAPGCGSEMGLDAPTVNLAEKDTSGVSPEETLALYYEYGNMKDWRREYAMFADESKAQVSEEQFVNYWDAAPPGFIGEYSFPSVEVNGDSATVTAVRTTSLAEGDNQDRVEQELVREDGVWKIVMRDDQIRAFGVA
jgi:hypothetical protein